MNLAPPGLGESEGARVCLRAPARLIMRRLESERARAHLPPPPSRGQRVRVFLFSLSSRELVCVKFLCHSRAGGREIFVKIVGRPGAPPVHMWRKVGGARAPLSVRQPNGLRLESRRLLPLPRAQLPPLQWLR